MNRIYLLTFILYLIDRNICNEQKFGHFNKNGGELGCVMYGTRPLPNNNAVYTPIVNKTDPKELDAEGLFWLKQLCPFLAGPSSINDPQIKTCCSTEHLKQFHTETNTLNNLITGCPSCKYAILTYGCNMICNPFQKNFVEIIDTITNDKNETLVSNINFYLNINYTNNIFNSCKDYKFSTGEKFVQTFLCSNAADASQCNSTVMLASMADNVGGFTVNNVIFSGDSKPPAINPVDSWVPFCGRDDEINGITVKKCSCKDCDSCDWNVAFPKSITTYVVGNITIWQFVFFLLAGIYFVIMTIFGFICLCKPSTTLTTFSSRSNSSILDVCQHSSIEETNEERIINKDTHEHAALYAEAEETPMAVLSPYTTRTVMNKILGRVAFVIVQMAIRYTYAVIGVVLLVCVIFSACIPFMVKITSDPVDLWSSPGSPIYEQMKDYESHFGKFYRTEQIIISNINHSKGITLDMIKFVDDIVSHIENVTISANTTTDNHNYTLVDFCVKPLYPVSNACVVYSIMQYFNNDRKSLELLGDNWKSHLKKCFNSPGYVPDGSIPNEITCIPTFLQPINPQLIVGDFEGVDYLNANTLVITFVLENPPTDENKLELINLWENEFIDYAKSLVNSTHLYSVTFSSERSIQDELAREAKYNMNIVLISYLVMFLYVSFSLGKLPRSIKTFLVDSKFMLGFCGVSLVFLSVTTAVGFLSIVGVKLNYIALEVLPFLILAIGVDNMFIICHSYYRIIGNQEEFGLGVDRNELDVNNCMTIAFIKIGPSIMISAVSQIVIFSLGTMSTVPVVRTFSIFASVALLINFILQISVFLSFFVLDSRREMANNNDGQNPHVGKAARYFMGPAHWVVKNVLGRMLLNKTIRFSIVVVFGTIWLLSLAAIPSVHIGLDQTLALPKDSYLQPYFKDLFKKLHFGAPVYFVVESGYKYQDPKKQDLICSLSYCNVESMTNYVAFWSRLPNISRIAAPLMSWLDVFLVWLTAQRGDGDNCCYTVTFVNNTVKYPNAVVGDYCNHTQYLDNKNIQCQVCLHENNIIKEPHPTPEQFVKLLPYFLSDVPGIDTCSFGGKSAFQNSVILNETYYGKFNIGGVSENISTANPVITSSFMTYHTPLITTDDFIDAIKNSMVMAENITSIIGTPVYTYSVFYIFYETFLDIRNTCYRSLGICCAAVFFSSLFLFSCDIRMTLIVSLTVIFMNVVNFAFLYVGQMAINPVSIVNLVMLFAINIEFVSHIAFAYMSCEGDSRLRKAYGALITSGGSVFSGIALTKIIGVSVLGFASSELFKIYYFRMYMFAVVVGALHGLIFLPAVLSYLGPKPKETIVFHEE